MLGLEPSCVNYKIKQNPLIKYESVGLNSEPFDYHRGRCSSRMVDGPVNPSQPISEELLQMWLETAGGSHLPLLWVDCACLGCSYPWAGVV